MCSGSRCSWQRTILGDFGLSALAMFPGYSFANCLFSGQCGGHDWAGAILAAMVPARGGGVAAEGAVASGLGDLTPAEVKATRVWSIRPALRCCRFCGGGHALPPATSTTRLSTQITSTSKGWKINSRR